MLFIFLVDILVFYMFSRMLEGAEVFYKTYLTRYRSFDLDNKKCRERSSLSRKNLKTLVRGNKLAHHNLELLDSHTKLFSLVSAFLTSTS